MQSVAVRMMLPLLVSMFAIAWHMSPAAAQSADGCTGNLSAQQIVGCLAPPPKTRGFPGTRTRGISVEGQETPANETSVNLMVNFDFNSAQLTNDGTISLDALGKALSDPSLQGAHYRIAGHTDAVGSDAYNQKLSEARAQTVLAYLTAHFHLPAAAFSAVGFGKTQLYDKDDPTAAVNRRVQVTRLGGSS